MYAKVEFDTVLDADETTELAIARLTHGLESVKGHVVTEHGPGGGHPIIAYEGDYNDLVMLAARYVGATRNASDESNLREALDMIKPEADFRAV